MTSADAFTRMAVGGEAIGFDYIEPLDIHARYPYSETGEFPRGRRSERHEAAMAHLAAKTSRIRFLTSVIVPHRPAVLTAKLLSTIDVMSGGWVIVGVGAGWLKEEIRGPGRAAFRRTRQGDGRISPASSCTLLPPLISYASVTVDPTSTSHPGRATPSRRIRNRISRNTAARARKI